MRTRDVIIPLVCIVIAAALLIAAGMQLDYINSQRRDMRLISNEPLENAPPSLAFATVAMGAFRGLVVDVLWLRADRLKQEGQFFDAKQLAEWITILQPRFVSVWEFHAWNMAYNISVAIPATQPEQRWRWVKNGYELLRDKGIVLNPKSILLYRELARIFQHKIAGVTDEAHKYYKLRLATAIEPLIGPADEQYFKALARTPARFEQILTETDVAPFIAALKSADKVFVEEDKFVRNYLALRQNPDKFNPDAFAVVDNFRGTRALEKFDIFARAHQLRDEWKLDPVLMQQLNEIYGPIDWDDPNKHLPLDWRHPDSHAIYWAVKGLQQAGGEYSLGETNTDRLVGHSLQNLFRNGNIFIYDIPAEPAEVNGQTVTMPRRKSIYLRQDLRMFEPYNQSLMAVLEKYKNIRKDTYESLQNGHRNMLINAALSFYQSGHMRHAQKVYGILRELYPRDEFKVSLLVFVKNRLRKELSRLGLNDVKENVQMLLRESYFRYAVRDDDEAFGRERMAKEVYDHYRSRYPDENRIDIPDFKLLRYLALIDFVNDNQYSRTLRRNLVGRIKVERPDLAKQLEKQEKFLLEKSNQSK